MSIGSGCRQRPGGAGAPFGVAALWAVAYWVNGWLRDWFLSPTSSAWRVPSG